MYFYIQRFLIFLLRLSLQKSLLVSKWVLSLFIIRVILVWFRRMMILCYWLSFSRLFLVCCVRFRFSWVDFVIKKKKILKLKGVVIIKEVIVFFCLNNFFNFVNLFFVRWSVIYYFVFQKMVLYLIFVILYMYTYFMIFQLFFFLVF